MIMNWIGYSIVWSIIIHMAVLIPIMITNYVFKEQKEVVVIGLHHTEHNKDRRQNGLPRLKRPNYEKRIRWDIDIVMILTKKRFTEQIEKVVLEKRLNYIDAIVYFVK